MKPSERMGIQSEGAKQVTDNLEEICGSVISANGFQETLALLSLFAHAVSAVGPETVLDAIEMRTSDDDFLNLKETTIELPDRDQLEGQLANGLRLCAYMQTIVKMELFDKCDNINSEDDLVRTMDAEAILQKAWNNPDDE